MASKPSILVFFMLLAMSQLMSATRQVPAGINDDAKSMPTPGALAANKIPGFVFRMPRGGINIPGSEYHEYIPGLDDTFLPNTGNEIPNPYVSAAARRP